MTRNQELIEKYKRLITNMEREINMSDDLSHHRYLYAKISVYKMVMIDLQE